MTPTAAQIAFVKWVQSRHPAIYQRAARKVAKAGGLGSLGWIEELINVIGQVGTELVKKKAASASASAQKKSDAAALALALLQTNTQRQASGLPPVDINGNIVNTATLPTPTQASVAQAARTIIPGIPNPVTYVGGAVSALLLLKLLKVL